MNIEVYSATKKPERLLDTSSAMYVITQEDIRRSGLGLSVLTIVLITISGWLGGALVYEHQVGVLEEKDK